MYAMPEMLAECCVTYVETHAMIYFLSQRGPEMYDYAIDPLDGDIDKVQPLDLTPDEGRRIKPTPTNQGRPLDMTHMPTRWRIGGRKRDLVDVQPGRSSLLVDEKLKTCVEALEPGVHQFFPIELVWKDGGHAASRYWFNVCTRLDGIDPEKTNLEFKGIWMGSGKPGEELWFSRKKIGGHHIWIERFMTYAPPPRFISAELKQALETAGVTGLNYRPYPETD
ncbi:imm11 family protein [Roseitalea porphyridii]|jgi:hypothetical protein|uniref:imm11 family protein n=2 Tax=Roseitalea porphyridii TaxID=1852022 RepID=UPI0032EF12A0